MLEPPVTSRQTPSARWTTAFFGATMATFLAASSAPTPIYRIYAEHFGASPVQITIVFAVYALALLTSLLFVGSLSDHLGRRPVVLAALLLEMVAMVLFAEAHGIAGLIAARTVQGFATGIATAALGAALVDIDRVTGPLINAVAPFAGMTAGILGSSTLVQFGPLPLQLVYGLLLLVFVLQTITLLGVMPETGTTRAGALASLRPRIAVPTNIRRRFLLISPINIANWALGGFYLSLVPSLVVSVTGSRAPLTGGMVVGALMLAGTGSILARRTRTSDTNLFFGVMASALGIAIVVAGVHLAAVPILLIGAMLTGMGFGTTFLGCLGAIVPLAQVDERAGLLSAFYIQSYLAFSVPAIAAGMLARAIGYAATADVFGIVIVVTGIAGLFALGLDRRRTADA